MITGVTVLMPYKSLRLA